MSSLQDPIVSHPVPSAAEERGITLRSFLIGLGVVCLVNLWVTWSDFIIHSSAWNLSHFPMVNFIPFVILTVLSSVSDRLFGPRWSFSSAELATVLAMGLVGSVVPTNGFMGYVLGILAMPYYLATPENGWALYFHPHLADWMAPRDENDAVRYFFEGLPKGVHIPWETWASPLFWWLTFAASITLISACTVVILRKQWTENERLDYPIISVGIDMALRSNPRNWLPEYMKGKLFWGGFSVACGIVCWNIPSYFIPGLPEFPLLPRWFTLAAGFPTIDFHISFFALAFAFFARLEALFSVWFFFLIFLIQSAIFNRFGFTIGTSGDPWSSHNPAVGWQSWGSLCFIVAWGIWVARHHLRDVFSKAIWGVPGEGRAEEMMSYRMALTGLISGLVYAIGFLYCAGMSYTMAIALLLSTLIGYLGVSRILVETGLLYVVVPVTGQSSTVYFLGSRGLPESSMTAMPFTYILVTRGAGMFMPSLTHLGKLADQIPQIRRRLIYALGASIVVGVLVAAIVTLYLGYTHGAYNFNVWVLGGGGSQRPFIDTLVKMQSPFTTDWYRVSFFLFGALVSAALVALRYRFPWWPLSPIGFPLATSWPMRRVGFTIFLAWFIKAMIMKLGGAVLYRRCQPFAVGLLVGWAAGVGISFLIDIFYFPGNGHGIHSY